VGLTVGFARADTVENRFYEAYYAERAQGNWDLAAQLYEKVADDRHADQALRETAAARLAVCREELASSDLARLMPPNAWAYVELKRPGDQVVRLLDALGLLAEPGAVPTEGQRRVAVSPALIKEALGIRGAAVAITGFDLKTQNPHGVLVFHPGEIAVVRGLLETGLPVGGEVVESIGGFPTYSVENEVLVTLTSRLVVVSPQRGHIEGVIDRLKGGTKSSMATNPALKMGIQDRDDALVMFFVNAKAMMPMIKPLLLAATMANREAAMAQTLLDIDSFDSLAGSLGVSESGLFLDLALRLDEDHRNLVFNFFRTPAINPDTFKCVPEGAAAVLAGALNSAGSHYQSDASGSTGSPPPVSALDIGREIFANITSFAAFALPPDGSPPTGGPPIPDVGLAMTVHDPAISEALWTQVLGLASFAAGAPAVAGPVTTIAGASVRSYQFPDGITVYFTTAGNDVLIGTTKAAIAASLEARNGGRSIYNDKAFKAGLARLTKDSTEALFIQMGRCAAIAKSFMSERDLAEAAPAFAMLADTTATIIEDYSGEVFRTSALISGIPNVGEFVSQMVTAELGKGRHHGRVHHAAKTSTWDEALKTLDAQLRDRPNDLELLKAKFDVLASDKKDRAAALALADSVYEQYKDDATTLNNLAWALLTESKAAASYGDLAVKLSTRSNELTDYGNWMFVDTLALAKFTAGDAAAAVKLENKAIELCGDCSGLAELKKAVARFEGGLHE
jgi:tetratricopeptide (TPR) repeat protein